MLISDLEYLASASQTSSIMGGGSNVISLSLQDGLLSVKVNDNDILKKKLTDLPSKAITFSVGDPFGSKVSAKSGSVNNQGFYAFGRADAKDFSVELKSVTSF
ncbi:MAG: hypothetical protein H0X31_10015 [Nostocaceae cyanobacterium]|nr:hypothetical protein [Nostocaceae cyanobacterium]